MTDMQRGRLLVTGQFILLGALALSPSPVDTVVPGLAFSVGKVLLYVGIIVTVLAFRSLGSSLTANPVPLENGTLVTRGMYARLRHPIYAGLLLLTAGMVLYSWTWIRLVVWLLLVALLTFKMRWEDELLLAKYPAYRDYMARVPAVLPRLR